MSEITGATLSAEEVRAASDTTAEDDIPFTVNLSVPQMGIWYTEKFYPGTGINNISATLRVEGVLDFPLLEKSFNEFLRLNDGARLRFCEINGEPRQYPAPFEPEHFEILDFQVSGSAEMSRWELEESSSPFFALNQALYKICFFIFENGDTGFFVKMHHTVCDAWSIVNVANNVLSIYSGLSRGTPAPEARPSYLSYIAAEQEYLLSEKCIKDKEFWANEFEEIPETTSIKARKTKNTSISADRKSFYLPAKLVDKLRSYSEANNASVFTLFMSALAMYISRVTGRNDVVLGIPSLNRKSMSEKDTIGLFVTTFPFRISLDNDSTYSSFSKLITKKWLSALRHHKYPVYQILRDLRDRQHDLDRLYDVVLSYQNAKFVKSSSDFAFSSEWHFQSAQNESLYVHISDREDDNQILVDYDYLTDVFHGKDIVALHDHFIRVLWHALDAAPEKKLHEIEMVSEYEKNLILHEFNNTQADFPRKSTLLDFFKAQVKNRPHEVAVIFSGKHMTFKELDTSSDSLAKHLVTLGVTRESIVALMLERSFEMIIAILAAWKAGGAYMPIDPIHPADRTQRLLSQSGAGILLTDEARASMVFPGITSINLGDSSLFSQTGKPSAPVRLTPPTPQNLAYVIYTSGSTGEPKGVMIEHSALMNRINWMQKKYPIGEGDVILQKTTYTFDVSVWELTWWMYTGATMAFLEQGEEKNPNSIIKAIEAMGVTTMHFVPSMLGAFLKYVDMSDKRTASRLHSLKRVFASGEALLPRHVEMFSSLITNNNGTTLHNLYGPTEAAIDVSYYDCPDTDTLSTVPIGRPIDNTQLYIVNSFLDLQPIGVAGELCIAGDCLSRGYLNNEKLTNERFIENPFSPGKKMYRTGDLARWYPRGDIEFLGRIDSQIKIRGFRVELGEIQANILSSGFASDAIVTCISNPGGDKSICTYVIFKEGDSSAALYDYLKNKIPHYMLPQSIIAISAIPLLQNGKIDYSSLPSGGLTTGELRKPPVDPRDDLEAEIHDVWRNVLGQNSISVFDDFFSNELGGDSIRAIEVVCALPKRPDFFVDIADFYANATIDKLAALYRSYESGNSMQKKTGFLVDITPRSEYPPSSSDNTEKINYILCPYGGGNAFTYVPLAQELCANLSALGKDCGVFAVNLPGHRLDGSDSSLVDLETAADQIMMEMQLNPHFSSQRVVVYAHCVGSALGLMLVRRLENFNYNVLRYFVGGAFPEKYIHLYPKRYDPWKFFNNDRVIKYLVSAGMPSGEIDESTKAEIMAAFRHDVLQYYSYIIKISREKSHMIMAPIIAIMGEEDKMTRGFHKKYKTWQKYTYGKVSSFSIPGAKHYFIKTHAAELAKLMYSELMSFPQNDADALALR